MAYRIMIVGMAILFIPSEHHIQPLPERTTAMFHRLNHLPIVAITLLLLLPVGVFADSPTDGPVKKPNPAWSKLVKQFDTNGDGKLDDGERQVMRRDINA